MGEMVDAWKTLILDYSMSNKLCPQTIGLITVLAISGSVVLLTLGKQKLLLLKNYGRRNKSARDIHSREKGLSSLIPSAEASTLDYNRMVEVMVFPDSREENGVARMNGKNSVGSEADGAASGLNVALPELKSIKDSSCADNKKPPVLKKVRFSADVIEPSGNNREYRRRMKSRYMQRSSMKEKETRKVTNDVSSIENGKHESVVGAAIDITKVNIGNVSPQNRQQTLASSKMPANRMALYAGMHRYRLQQALHC